MATQTTVELSTLITTTLLGMGTFEVLALELRAMLATVVTKIGLVLVSQIIIMSMGIGKENTVLNVGIDVRVGTTCRATTHRPSFNLHAKKQPMYQQDIVREFFCILCFLS